MTAKSKTFRSADQQLSGTHRKSPLIAYAALFLTGALGGHRHYMGYGGTGFIQTLLGLTAAVSAYISWPYVQGFWTNPEASIIADDETFTWMLTALCAVPALGLWLVADLFRIPSLAARKIRKSAPASQPASSEVGLADIITKFSALRASGALSEEEFRVCKQQFLGLYPAATPAHPDGHRTR